MSIDPFILLGIGICFALLYGLVITVGWAITRKCRQIIQDKTGTSLIPIKYFTKENSKEFKETISLTGNQFYDKTGRRIGLSEFNAYIAGDTSKEYPEVKPGNLILIEKDTQILKYIFDIPNLKNYR